MSARPAQPKPSTTKTAWKSSGNKRITLPSGIEVTIRPLRLEHYMTHGRTPDALRVIALGDLRATLAKRVEELSPEARAQAYTKLVEEYMHPGILKLVVDPEITLDDIPDLPPADIDMLVGILNMNVTEDAKGRSLGVEPLDRWGIFREKHHCADGCPSCEAAIGELSAALG